MFQKLSIFLFFICVFHIHLFATTIPTTQKAQESSEKAVSSVFYTHISELFPSQLRYASKNVTEKAQKILKNKDAVWDENQSKWEYKYYNGLSALAEKDAIPVVKAPFGYALIDGHHNVLSSISVGADWIPVILVDDLSNMSYEDFWEKAEDMGWAYLYDINGQKSYPPTSFDQLQDDPNRYFAAIAARKYLNEFDPNSIGAEYPIWIKIGKDIPFIEFKISDALWNSGVIYSYDMGDNPSEEFVEAARRALIEANIPGLKVIPERTHYPRNGD